MTSTARDPVHRPPGLAAPNRLARRRMVRLRHIHPMTREQQIALVEEARAARRTEQERQDDDRGVVPGGRSQHNRDER